MGKIGSLIASNLFAMLKNYIKTALRNLARFKGYAFINIIGLAIGMACVILIMLFVKAELSVDNYHPNSNQVYRLNIQVTNPQTGAKNQRAVGPYRLADELAVDFNDFEHLVRIAPQGNELIEYNNEQFVEENLAFADPSILEVFHFPLIQGNPETALDDPYSLIVTPEVAKKYFGDEDPIGKQVKIRDRDFAISGIMEPVPENTQFEFDIIVSMNCAKQVFSRIVLENWGEGYVETFAMVPEGKGEQATMKIGSYHL